jgi:hypothetical protein
MLDVSDRLFQELADVVVVQVVHDLAAVASTDHQPEVTQNAKLMGHRRRFHPHCGRKLVDWRGPSVQQSENAQPARGRERLHRLSDSLGKLRVKP